MESSATHLSLLDLARARDEIAWRQLVDLYSPLVIQWCRRLKVDQEATADCIQEVFAAVARALDTYHPPGTTGAFRGWLWTITRNKLRDAARRNRGHAQAQGGSTALAVLHTLAEPTDELREEPSEVQDTVDLTARALSQIEASFAPQTWQAFWRSAIDGLPTDVVATQLNMSVSSVRQARSRVLRRLRQQLLDL